MTSTNQHSLRDNTPPTKFREVPIFFSALENPTSQDLNLGIAAPQKELTFGTDAPKM